MRFVLLSTFWTAGAEECVAGSAADDCKCCGEKNETAGCSGNWVVSNEGESCTAACGRMSDGAGCVAIRAHEVSVWPYEWNGQVKPYKQGVAPLEGIVTNYGLNCKQKQYPTDSGDKEKLKSIWPAVKLGDSENSCFAQAWDIDEVKEACSGGTGDKAWTGCNACPDAAKDCRISNNAEGCCKTDQQWPTRDDATNTECMNTIQCNYSTECDTVAPNGWLRLCKCGTGFPGCTKNSGPSAHGKGKGVRLLEESIVSAEGKGKGGPNGPPKQVIYGGKETCPNGGKHYKNATPLAASALDSSITDTCKNGGTNDDDNGRSFAAVATVVGALLYLIV